MCVDNNINGEDFEDSDYEHLQRICKTFGFQNMGQYLELYVKSDFLILKDVFEKFETYACGITNCTRHCTSRHPGSHGTP